MRVTVATLLTYVLSLLLNVPQVLWTVLTAVVMSQLSLGKSLKTAIDYFFGTVGGAVYSGLVSAFVPHQTELQFLIVLTLSIAPLAFLGAIWPRLSVAPFTAVMVLLAPTITHASPLQSAFYRVSRSWPRRRDGAFRLVFRAAVPCTKSRRRGRGADAAADGGGAAKAPRRLHGAARRRKTPRDTERPRSRLRPAGNHRRRGAAPSACPICARSRI